MRFLNKYASLYFGSNVLTVARIKRGLAVKFGKLVVCHLLDFCNFCHSPNV